MRHCAEDSAHYNAHRRCQNKAAPEFLVPEPLVLLRQFIADLAVAFLLVVSSFHLPAARVPGRDRLRQARRLVAVAAVAAGAGARAAAAERERPAFFLFGRAPHPWLRHQEAA